MSPIKTWLLLKNNDQVCFGKIDGCVFNTSSRKKIYLIGNSDMAALALNLKDRVIKKNYQFFVFTMGNCLFYPGFNLMDIKTNKLNEACNNAYFKKIKEILFEDKNSIIIFGARLPLHLSNFLFNDIEEGIEEKKWEQKYVKVGEYDNIQKSFENEIKLLSKNNEIILVYPIPEIGFNVPHKLNSIYENKP